MLRWTAALAAFLVLAIPATAQQHTNMPGMDTQETRSNAPFRPGLGDLMTAFVQPHHIKLGLAGAAQNWPLADYELDELKETFDTVAKLILKHGRLSIPEAIKSTVVQPLDAVDAAIKAKDPAAFTKAYVDLTSACNACHQSAAHPMIVIKVPDISGTAFPDQDFNPLK